MQGQAFRNWEIEHEFQDFILFSGPYQAEQEKIQPSNQKLNISIIKQGNKGKKQGRPRGEKNTQGRAKRSKDQIPEDKKQKGHWSIEENKRYHWFLQIYHLHFIKREMRRLDKIFKTMALFIGSREAEQCRSHHQKMQKKYQSFSKILLHLRKEHYQRGDIEQIERDIESLEVNEHPIILKYEDLQKIEAERKENKEEKIKYREMEQIQKKNEKFQKESLLEDILGDNYEYNFEINNLLI